LRTLGTAIVVVAAMAAGCGQEDGGAADGPPQVVITDRGYDPAELTIEVGERVRFVNRAKERPHSAKDESGGDVDVSPQPGATMHDGSEVNRATRKGFATHSLFPSEWQFVVFPVVGTYEYTSAFDPDFEGTIEVVPKGEG
jgi:plastocyanin